MKTITKAKKNIPDGWKEVKLGEVINIIGGGTPKTSISEYWNGNIPWLSVVDFNTGHKFVYKTEKNITEQGLKNSSTKLLEKGDIIISARGTVGVIAVLGRSMTFNQSCYGITKKEGISDQNYIYYLLKDLILKLKQHSYGGVFDTITTKTFDDIPILLPPLQTQKNIAEVLSSLDDKIDLLNRQNKTLEDMAQALFRKWFVDNPERERWEKGKLGDEFLITMGQSPPGSSYNANQIGVAMFQGNADFKFRFPTKRVYTTEPKRFAEKFDTLISVRAPVGAQNMAQEKCCIGRGIASFRYLPNKDFYTYTYFKMRSLMDEIKRFNNAGTVFGSISKKDFEKIKVDIPKQETISEFQTIVKPIDNRIIQNQSQIRTLENLRDTLLPKLMSGEVRVK